MRKRTDCKKSFLRWYTAQHERHRFPSLMSLHITLDVRSSESFLFDVSQGVLLDDKGRTW